MRLFISYARVDKPYCIQIAETLEIHEIWYDQRLYAGQDWWSEILLRLEWCEGFVYLMSPDSVISDYCLKELTIAMNLGRHIFPVLIHEKTVIPESIRHFQYADLSNGLTPEAVKTLLNAIHVSERQGQPRKPVVRNIPQETKVESPIQDFSVIVGKAAEAMESGRFDHAVFLLKQAQENGYKSRFVNLTVLLQEAELALERQANQREAEREYKPIVELVKWQSTRRLGCDAFRAFAVDFPSYDPDNLASICISDDTGKAEPDRPVSRPRPTFTMPLLEWCEIPNGVVSLQKLNGGGRMHRDSAYIEAFQMSKYPVTNMQFQVFINDPDGYANPAWWDFSDQAHKWRRDTPLPRDSRFKGDERPRENVTWYEAMAFCNWLSAKTGLRIALPTDLQWQRAARGESDRLFPWGNDFSTDYANTRESKIRMTTVVMRYEKGLSPFGVFDMSGNVWEWCLNSGVKDSNNQEGENMRAIYGGSFISVCDRAQTNFHFNLNPEYYYGTIGFRLITDR